MKRLHTLALTLTFLTFAPQHEVIAQQPPDASNQVTIRENFSPFEIGTIGLGATGAIFLIGFGEDVFGHPVPSIGPPDPQSVDWRFTHWANEKPDPVKKWIGGAPDRAGYVLPFAALGLYATGSIGHAINPDFPLASKNHELLAFTESIAWTMFVTNVFKLMVGRARPFTVREDLDPVAFGEPEKEYFLSFPSGHSASAASTTTFLALDLSAHLVHHTLRDSHPVLRYGLGYGLPLLGAASISGTVMFSRIRDQRHWLSDTLTGAMIGAGFSTIFYTMHFDNEGNPRKRHDIDVDEDLSGSATIQQSFVTPIATPSGPMLQYGLIF